jgi:hypothetical protein
VPGAAEGVALTSRDVERSVATYEAVNPRVRGAIEASGFRFGKAVGDSGKLKVLRAFSEAFDASEASGGLIETEWRKKVLDYTGCQTFAFDQVWEEMKNTELVVARQGGRGRYWFTGESIRLKLVELADL